MHIAHQRGTSQEMKKARNHNAKSSSELGLEGETN